ncbi:MAG TPA: MBL fold metallo-hydrolase [Dehalococcoidia bacterium]|nr:MBL fold metallo-hydrolase [Dehalococcoidia bacterium]
MKLKWLGHASFLVTSDTGLRIVTDPYSTGSGINYSPVNEPADIVVVSHDHFDHNAVASVPGKPEVVTGSGTKSLQRIQFKGIATHHDESQGKERGSNTIFCFTIDGIKLCHLGDLGHKLAPQQIADIGEVDVLLIPVGGFFTIDARVATQVCDDLKPRVIIPMHYKTPKCDFPIAGVDDFLAGKQNVRQLDSSEVEFRAGELPPATQIIVLQPAC